MVLSTFCTSAQTLSRGTANEWPILSLSLTSLSEIIYFFNDEDYRKKVLLSFRIENLLLQSCELAQRLRSSPDNVPCFLRPQPVIDPRRENARVIMGDDGTLLGLNRSEPVSHRNCATALLGTRRERETRKTLNNKDSN